MIFGLCGTTLTTRFRELGTTFGTSRSATQKAGACAPALSDGQLMTGLLDVDPLSAEALAVRREHVIDVLRTAVAL